MSTPVAEPIRVMIVDDDEGVLRALALLFGRRSDFTCITASDPFAAIALAAEERPDVVLSDIFMPQMDGLTLLGRVKDTAPDCEVILMTGAGTVRAAVGAVRAGAYDFLTKPFEDVAVVELAVRQAAERKRFLTRNSRLEAALAARDSFEGLIGSAPKMLQVYKLIETIADSDATVLIGGESGTGKELVARALHLRGPRRTGPLLAVNCSALPAGLIESELFGHTRGAFTGAIAAKKGFFEAAHGGTLFLDEIADLPPNVQVALLRVLQEREIRRVGSNATIKTDVRIIAASNIDLGQAVARGTFREDLFYRLNVVPIHLPALRDRVEDIPALAQHFLEKYARRSGKPASRLSAAALGELRAYRWPGNVRELENAMQRAMVLARDELICSVDLPPQIKLSVDRLVPEVSQGAQLRYVEAKREAIEMFERRYLGALMRKCDGNISEAARCAVVDPSNLRRLLQAHRVDTDGVVDLPSLLGIEVVIPQGPVV